MSEDPCGGTSEVGGGALLASTLFNSRLMGTFYFNSTVTRTRGYKWVPKRRDRIGVSEWLDQRHSPLLERKISKLR